MVLISPRFSNTCYFLFSPQIIIAIIVGVKWYLTVLLICITLIAISAEHLFMCLLGFCGFMSF